MALVLSAWQLPPIIYPVILTADHSPSTWAKGVRKWPRSSHSDWSKGEHMTHAKPKFFPRKSLSLCFIGLLAGMKAAWNSSQRWVLNRGSRIQRWRGRLWPVVSESSFTSVFQNQRNKLYLSHEKKFLYSPHKPVWVGHFSPEIKLILIKYYLQVIYYPRDSLKWILRAYLELVTSDNAT